jgi:hypothetical protein
LTSQSSGSVERVALSQELSEFLIEFSIALHRTSMYPWGHPSLERAASAVVGRLATLLADRPSISIGVAKKQLVIEGIATDPKHPVLRSLAEKLHRHHLGAVVFERGVRTEEVIAMMRLIGVEPERDSTPLGLGDPQVLRQWQSARLYPLTYEQLQLLGADIDEDESKEHKDRSARSAQLWIGLARAALAREDIDLESAHTEPSVVAEAINGHPAAGAYDQIIVGYLLQLAEELKQEGGVGSAAVRRRLSGLINALDDATLERLIDMGGDLPQRKRFLLDAADALTVDAVVDLVQAAAASTKQTISTSMVRLLTKLSAFAEQGTHQIQLHADTALREQVQLLMEGWTMEDPNPDAYTRALESLARRPQTLAATAKTQLPPEPLRIVQMALEVQSLGVPFWRAVEEVLRQDGLAALVMLLHSVEPDNAVAQALLQHLATPDRLREALSRENVDFDALGRVLDYVSEANAAPLLMRSLIDSEFRDTRIGVFTRLAKMDILVLEPLILTGLTDPRWFVRRNMLALLNEKNAFSEALNLGAHVRDRDARVRREALLVWLRSPTERDRAVAMALNDADERILRVGVNEARSRLPETAVAVVIKRLHEDLPADLRAQLVRLLERARGGNVLEALLRIAAPTRSLLGRPRLAPSSPAMLAALSVLAASWSDERRAAAVLKRAQKAPEAEVRTAALGVQIQ